MSQNKRKGIQIFLTAIVICIGSLLLFHWYSSIIAKNAENTAKTYLHEINVLNASKIQNQFNGYFQNLNAIASSLCTTDDISSTVITQLAQSQFIQKNFKDIGFILPNGKTITSSNKEVNVSDREYFKSAMLGIPSVSTRLNDKGDNSLVYVVAVPIYQDNSIVGVLYASVCASDLAAALDTAFFEKQGEFFIINADGNKVFDSVTLRPSMRASIVDAVSEQQEEKIKSDFTFGNSDVIPISLNDQTVYLGYTPLGFQNWYLASVINASAINSQNSSLIVASLLFIGAFGILFLAFLLFIMITYAKNKERIHNTKVELETVIANIPGGVVRFAYDDNLSIEFLNDSLFNLTGFTKYDIENILENSFLNLVHEEDRQDLASAIVDQMTTGRTVELDCRVKCHDGKFSWFLFKGRMITDNNDNNSCLCVLTDINDTKQAQQELNLSIQRYRIVTEQSESIIFEYNFMDGSIYLSDKWNEKFDNDIDMSNFIDYVISKKLVHPDDMEMFIDTFNLIKEGSSSQTVEVRLHNINDKYTWCRIQLSSVINEKGLVYKSVGRITDIDIQKRETENLKKKAELDSLTGLYNKGTAKMLIDDFLSGEGKNGKHSIMILDIDNFKKVNDNLGHLVGDAVISDITARIKKLVRASDICGRIGGDEFVVLLKNTIEPDIINAKATDFGAAFRHTICNETNSISISGSIGIALYDKDGTNYTELIDKADTALYVAKKRGKDQYAFYGKEDS